MHLLQILTVLTALAWWYAVRARRLVWWLPLLAFATAAFLIKEDGIMLLPAIVAVHEIRRWTVEPLPRIRVGFIVLAASLLAGLMLWRTDVLGGVGGYTRPVVRQGLDQLLRTLAGVYRLVPADRPWQPLASWFATLTPLAALIAWRWASRGARFCVAAGAAIAMLFAAAVRLHRQTRTGLPARSRLLDRAHRRHPRARGSCGAVATAAARRRDRGRPRAHRHRIDARGHPHITRDFEPFGPFVLANDDIVQTWGFVPPEIKDYLVRKREPNAASRLSANVLDEILVATFNTHGRDVTPDGVPYMWMDRGGRKFRLPPARATSPFRSGTRSKSSASQCTCGSKPTAGWSTNWI